MIRVKVDATGAELAVGKSVPGLLERLLPFKTRIRRNIDNAIAEAVTKKITHNRQLDAAELAFAEDLLSEHARKYLAFKNIQERATEIYESNKAVYQLGSAPSDTSESVQSDLPEGKNAFATPDDWINKFRDDASLVDDDLVREIYARVLAEEARQPTSFTLRTLGVLRYLDRETAEAFAKLQKVVVDGLAVPQQTTEADHILQRVGLNHTAMLMLNDAGLVSASAQSTRRKEGEVVTLVCTGHQRVILAQSLDNSKMTLNLKVHLLTPAGRQLSRIAETEPDEAVFEGLVELVRKELPNIPLYVAELPFTDWEGTIGELNWELIPV